jgi:hypothetical protein
MALALREVARRPAPSAAGASRAMLATARAAMESQRLVIAERDRLRYRVKPLERLDELVARRPLRWLAAPLRRIWRRVRPR